ncbi:CBS domain-containing protein [Mangrovimonas aestuarii]|uniref:CBS domain-containing protein n=1 Tax=Mangrovimonas aestuarii TaxID=3018443 RepID=UPI002378559F|nr:CBS domain-containing protein [Mangrovimonas aestuarii]
MNLQDYIVNDIEPVKMSSKISDLQLLFNQLTYSHFPIINEEGVYLGSISEADVYCFDSNKFISEYAYTLSGFYVRDTSNWLDVLEIFAQNHTNVMPVLDIKNNYLGYYELNDIIGLFNKTPFFSEPGGILVVEKGVNDYSFSEISQIIESNNGRLLGTFISSMNQDTVQVTIKIGQSGLNDIIQTFRRYSYNIISGHEEDTYLENLKKRSDYLNKYLDI